MAAQYLLNCHNSFLCKCSRFPQEQLWKKISFLECNCSPSHRFSNMTSPHLLYRWVQMSLFSCAPTSLESAPTTLLRFLRGKPSRRREDTSRPDYIYRGRISNRYKVLQHWLDFKIFSLFRSWFWFNMSCLFSEEGIPTYSKILSHIDLKGFEPTLKFLIYHFFLA